LLTCLCAFAFIPFLGQDFFPATDSGQFILHVRAKTGMRIDETARLTDLVETSIRKTIPPTEVDNILDNIGLPSNINYMYNNTGLTGAADVDVLVSLKERRHRTADYVLTLRDELPREFPGTTFYFTPADIVTQILNFGLPAPIDVQIDGPDIDDNQRVADKMLGELSHVRGIADLRIQQQSDYPKYHIEADRTKAVQGGFTDRDIATIAQRVFKGVGEVMSSDFIGLKSGYVPAAVRDIMPHHAVAGSANTAQPTLSML
jgi:multidrug efflux pump subunit AcrB